MNAQLTITAEAGGLRVAGEVGGRIVSLLVRVREEKRRHCVEVVNDRGQQAGTFGWYGSPERAVENAQAVALVLAAGQVLAGLKGAPAPYTAEAVELAAGAARRTAKLLGRDKAADSFAQGGL